MATGGIVDISNIGLIERNGGIVDVGCGKAGRSHRDCGRGRDCGIVAGDLGWGDGVVARGYGISAGSGSPAGRSSANAGNSPGRRAVAVYCESASVGSVRDVKA